MSLRRVVVTGLGIVSCLGNDGDSVAASLRHGTSGIRADAGLAQAGLRSQVSGKPVVDLDATIDRRLRRFMGDAAAYAWLATQQAVAHAGLTDERLRHPRSAAVHEMGESEAGRPPDSRH